MGREKVWPGHQAGRAFGNGRNSRNEPCLLGRYCRRERAARIGGYWHGNGYFKALGATIVAQKEADRVMRDMGAGQLDSNKTLLKEKADGTVLAYPAETFDAKRELKLGKTTVQLLYFGPAHTPGDIAVWLPAQKIVFAGDIVFTERMLAIIPIGHTGGWVQAFDKLAALKPRVVVPGHGKPTDLKHAKKTRVITWPMCAPASKKFWTTVDHCRMRSKKPINRNLNIWRISICSPDAT